MAKEGNKKWLAWAGDGGMGWDGSETRRKMTEGSDTTRLHRPPGSTCLARVARGGSARGGGLSNGRWTLDVVDEDEKRMSTEEGGRDDGVLDAVWPCRWRRGTLSRWVAVAAGCHGMPAAGPPWAKATSSRLFGGWDAAHAGRVVCEGQEDTRWRWWYSARPRGRWRGLLEEARRPTGAKHTGTQPARLWLKSNGRYQVPHRLGGKNERTRTENDQPPSGQV